MRHNLLHLAILVTALITALIHLVLLNLLLGSLDLMFTLNGLGFLALLALFFWMPGALAQQRTAIHWAFIAYSAVTIVAWIILGDKGDLLGILTKVDELALILALLVHLRAPSGEVETTPI